MIRDSEQLIDILNQVWTSVLGRMVDETGGDSFGTGAESKRLGWCETVGLDPSIILLECSEDAARLATTAFFDIEPENVTEDDIDDAMEELINMVGGLVKSMVCDSARLLLPTGGREWPAELDKYEPSSIIFANATCDGSPVSVAVMKSKEAQATG